MTVRTDVGKGARYVASLIEAGHDLDWPALATDAHTLQKNLGRWLGENEDTELSALNRLLDESAESLRLVRAIASHFVIPAPVLPSGTWTYQQGGTKFQGRSPMPASFTDDSAPWGVAVTDLKDARGENAGPGATVALSVDDADVVALVDNGDGTGTVAPGPLATSDTPASTAIHATITNTDGTSFVVDDVITIVGADAVTGTFGFTPPA